MKGIQNYLKSPVERDKPKKSESVGQTLPQLPWKQKRGDAQRTALVLKIGLKKFL
jgi:hypothetical protein